ncbi:MAG: glutamine amidotransferase [Rhodospirillales bacterium]
MPSVLALQHVAFEDLGSIESGLEARGWPVRYADAATADFGVLDPLADGLLIVLGGPIGACEEDAYPFLKDELRFVEKRLTAGLPVLGICLGAQIMARCLGARVYPGPVTEIGWAPLILTEAGKRSPLRHLAPEKTSMLHWHGDTFDLPDGAALLASTESVAHQAYAWGPAALAVQFHPEITARGLERWFVGHAVEIAGTPGVDVARLRADTGRYAAALERQGRLWFEAWLDEAAG